MQYQLNSRIHMKLKNMRSSKVGWLIRCHEIPTALVAQNIAKFR